MKNKVGMHVNTFPFCKKILQLNGSKFTEDRFFNTKNYKKNHIINKDFTFWYYLDLAMWYKHITFFHPKTENLWEVSNSRFLFLDYQYLNSVSFELKENFMQIQNIYRFLAIICVLKNRRNQYKVEMVERGKE